MIALFNIFILKKKLTSKLVIETFTNIDIEYTSNQSFKVFPEIFKKIPFFYPTDIIAGLTPYMMIQSQSSNFQEITTNILSKSNYFVLDFLENLNTYIYENFKREYREFGYPNSPETTLNIKKGSCRDLAVLMIEICRSIGIASRFVSGYYYDETVQNNIGELHAWAEFYIPGCGWIGYDPSYNITINHHHIPICASYSYQNCLPLTGTYLGSAKSNLDTNVSISTIFTESKINN